MKWSNVLFPFERKKYWITLDFAKKFIDVNVDDLRVATKEKKCYLQLPNKENIKSGGQI